MRYAISILMLSVLAWPGFAWSQAPVEKPLAEITIVENPAAQKATDLAVQRGIEWLARRQCASCHFSVPEKTTVATLLEASKVEEQQFSTLLRAVGRLQNPCLRDAEKKEQVTYLGVSLTAVPAAVRRHVKIPARMGLLVETVDVGSPAQAAGVVRNDVLLKIDEQWLVNPEQFTALIRTYPPAGEVKLTAIQRSETKVLSARLASREAQNPSSAQQFKVGYVNQLQVAHGAWREGEIAADVDKDGFLDILVANKKQAQVDAGSKLAADVAAAQPRKLSVTYLGVQTASPSEALAKQLRLAPGLALMIESVEEKTAAAQAGLKPFDVLQKLDDQLLVNGEQFTVLIRAHKLGDEVNLALIREGKPQTVRVALGQFETEVAAEDLRGDDGVRFGSVDLDVDLHGDVVTRGVLARWLDTGENVRPADPEHPVGGGDAEFIRRTYLDLLGILPTAAEAKAFVENTDKLKRKELLDELLSRPEAISRASGSWAVKWNDAQHVLALVSKDGHRYLTVRRLEDGKSLFDGPVDTQQQQQVLPEDVANKLAVMLKSQASGPTKAATAADILERVLPRVELTEVPLKRAIEQLREQTGANLVVSWKSLKQAGISADEPITLVLRDVRVSSALSTLLALASDDKARLGYTLDGEVILISVKGK